MAHAGLLLREFGKRNPEYRPKPTFLKISELKAWLVADPAFVDSYGDLTHTRIEFWIKGKPLSDAALIPRAPECLLLEFVIPETRRFTLVFEHSQRPIIFEASVTVADALRKLAVDLRVPVWALSLRRESGSALRGEESLRSLPELLRVQTEGWLEIPVQSGQAMKSYFLPSGAIAADLRSALWFDCSPRARLCDSTFSIGDRTLALTDALAAAGISARRFVSVRFGRPLASETAELAVRFPNGELLQKSLSVEAPLSLALWNRGCAQALVC
jgi:hypothetical protein